MDCPDMDKLLDELEQSSNVFVKCSAYIFEPNASCQSLSSKFPVELTQSFENEGSSKSVSESSPSIALVEVLKEEKTKTKIKSSQQPGLEDRLELDEKNNVSSAVEYVLVEPGTKKCVSSSDSVMKPHNEISIPNESKDALEKLDADIPSAVPLLIDLIAKAIDVEKGLEEKIQSKDNVQEVHCTEESCYYPVGESSFRPCSMSAKTEKDIESALNKNKVCTEQLIPADQSKKLLLKADLCNGIECSTEQPTQIASGKITVENRFNEPDVKGVTEHLILVEENAKNNNCVELADKVISRDDLYEEIEQMEKLILAEKRDFLQCDTPSVCVGKDVTALVSSTINKSILTAEENSLISRPSNREIVDEQVDDKQIASNRVSTKKPADYDIPETFPELEIQLQLPTLENIDALSVHRSDSGEVKQFSSPENSQQLQDAQGIKKSKNELAEMMEEEAEEKAFKEKDENVPSTSSETPSSYEEPLKRSVVSSTHNFDISVINSQIKLTESELQLAKVKPYWIPDLECMNCMLCLAKFTIVNRRHHCRSCGRVLCSGCCAVRRMLPYMESTKRKQRVCAPCNTTLELIEKYEKSKAAEEKASINIQKHQNNSNQDENPINSSSTLQSEVVFSSLDNKQPSKSLNESKKCISVPRKKSVLKVRLPPVDGVGLEPSSPAPTGEVADTPLTLDTIIPTPTTTPTLSSPLLAQPKRSVTFRDGVNPGDSPTTSRDNLKEGNEEDVPDGGRLKKNSKKISRRTMERRADEENTSFLCHQPEFLFLANSETQFTRVSTLELVEQLASGILTTVAIKRNLHVVVQKTKISIGEKSENPVVCYSTRGFNAIGVDEILLVVEARASLSNAEESGEEKIGSYSEEYQQDLIEVLLQLEDIFATCLNPSEDTLDDKMGIRRCCNRMEKMYITKQGQLAGIEASAIYLHRPQGQLFGDLPVPCSPFLIGTLLKKEEITWAICIPNRVLFSLGKQSSYYPIPLVNARQRAAVFTADQTQASVLKVFNDFRNWNYRIAKLPGSFVSLSDSKTEVVLPEWAVDEVKSIVETNRNMLGWALDFNQSADSHLVCEQNSETGAFQTHILSNHCTRKSTGASFIIFDGALKNSSEKFELSVVEDGLIVRMQADTHAEMVKALLAGDNFNIQTANMQLEVAFRPSQPALHTQAALVSPIDGHNLMGKYQYGLILNRQFRSQNFIPSATEWALRLATVINMDNGKFPSLLQPKFFEVCEQIVVITSHTIQPFIAALVAASQRTICLRIRVDDECAIYDSEQWSQLEDQHYFWTNSLDEQMIPFLYSICAWVPNGLHIEVNLSLISTRPLPIELTLGKNANF